MVIPVCLLLVAVNLGVGFLVGDDDRQVQIGGIIGAVPLLLVDLVVWIIVSGACGLSLSQNDVVGDTRPVKIDKPQTPRTTTPSKTPSTTPSTTVQKTPATTSTTLEKTTSTKPAETGDGKRFDAHSLPPPSSAVHQPQPGKRAELDLRSWMPSQLREAMLGDIQLVYELLVKLPAAVTFFGGARIKEGDPYYAISQQIGALLAEHGASLRTGAGPGIMTAGPEGYKKALQELQKQKTNSTTVTTLEPATALHPAVSGMTDATKTQGFRIRLPFEQSWSDAIDVGAEAKLFPYRKLALYENCKGVAVFPGGYGTLDELFEVMALSAHGRFGKPIAGVGVDFWKTVLDPIESVAVKGRKLIPESEWQKLVLTDDPKQLVAHLDGSSSSSADGRGAVKAWERDPVARAKKLSREIEESINVLDRLPPAVTFLGARRLDDNDPTLAVASKLAEALTKEGVALRVGSAGVVAEAVCKGAAAVDKDVIVQGVLLSDPQHTSQDRALANLQVHQKVDELITHKEIIARRSQAFVALPGGLNTLGEVFSVLTQIQTGHLPKIPIVLVGKDYWQPIFDAIKTKMLSPERKTISPEDLDLVVITDDPQQALLAMQPALSKSTTTTVSVHGTAAATLFEGDKTTMLNPPGAQLASWLMGETGPQHAGNNVIAAGIDHDAAVSRAFVVEQLEPALINALDNAGVDLRHVAWALDHGVDDKTIKTLLTAGSGPEAFRFLWSCAPVAAYRDIGTHALAIAARWAPQQDVVFQRFTELSTSLHLQNPDALKSWLEGIGAPGAPGDGYCTMLGDAWDLVSAGHKIAVEEHAKGTGDIIDLTTSTTYQHKRVLSKHLAPALKKAAEQLKGTQNAEGAPAGMRGVVHLDLRNNGHWNAHDDAEIARRVSTMSFAKDRVDVVHLLLDDRLLSFDRFGKLMPA